MTAFCISRQCRLESFVCLAVRYPLVLLPGNALLASLLHHLVKESYVSLTFSPILLFGLILCWFIVLYICRKYLIIKSVQVLILKKSAYMKAWSYSFHENVHKLKTSNNRAYPSHQSFLGNHVRYQKRQISFKGGRMII